MKTLVLIKADCTQLGLSVEASRDGGKNWAFVQLHPYAERSPPTVRAYSRCIDPGKDRDEYFADLDKRGIQYKRARDAHADTVASEEYLNEGPR